MKTSYTILFIALICSQLMLTYSCAPDLETDLKQEALLPFPNYIESEGKACKTEGLQSISYEHELLESEAEYLQEKMVQITNVAIELNKGHTTKGGINLILIEGPTLNEEAYEIDIESNLVNIKAVDKSGIFYGIQTLIQLLQNNIVNGYIPTGYIADTPEYIYRGSMLDVSRHFFSVKDVKRYIDLIAQYKLNFLHLGLSNDQGWRIEIKSWPKLTSIGGQTQVGGGKGGFYTQEKYKDIVAYASTHHITIIPEIDMPGHTNAALASYPELNCDQKPRELYTGIDVGFSTLCTDSEITYQFVDDVVREISEITPGPYFHIGGDESHVTPMEKYIPFINRAAEIVKKYDKKVIGWDEISHAGLNEGTMVQYWANAENAIRGIEKGARVIMSPASRTYLDMQYDSTTKLGLHWAAYIEIDSSYIWDPAQFEKGIKKEHILGIESPLWTETITNMEEIEYMVFPRIISHAELGWTKANLHNWEHFRARLAKHGPIMEAKSINFYRSAQIEWQEVTE